MYSLEFWVWVWILDFGFWALNLWGFGFWVLDFEICDLGCGLWGAGLEYGEWGMGD